MSQPIRTDRPTPDRSRRSGGSTVVGGTAMLVLAIVLSWLPILGPAIAGFVGGRIIARPGPALVVALIPAVVLAVLTVVVLAAFELPVLGAVAGAGVALAVLVGDVPLLLGAWLGARSR